MFKRFLAVTKLVGWFTMCGFAGHGAGTWIREEGIEKKSLPKTILGIIGTVFMLGTCHHVGRKLGEETYDAFVEEDGEGRSR